MNILIVDDDRYVLEDIIHSVEFHTLGIQDVFTALNIYQAKDILAMQDIKIVISDIDMPGGSGLDLLKHIKDNYPKVQTFFITCHADFQFAKQAIRLGCLDYLLKPLDYNEVIAIIKQAIERILQENETENLSRYQSYWFKHQPRLIEQFWNDIIKLKIPSDLDFLAREAEKRNIPFQPDIQYLPILVCIQYSDEILSVMDESIISFGIQNIGEELLTNSRKYGHFFEISSKHILGMFPLHTDTVEQSKNAITMKLNRFVNLCHEYLVANLSCYVGIQITLNELSPVMEALTALNKNNIAYYNNVFYLEHMTQDNAVSPPVDMSSWAMTIQKGNYNRIITEISQLFDAMVSNKTMTYCFAVQFQQDFLQLIYHVLREKNLKAHLILEDKEVLRLYQNSTQSINQLKEWIICIFTTLNIYFTNTDKTQMLLNHVKTYIENNLHMDLSREDIAKMVFLNPDYLDRLFKKYFKMSVSKYVMQERMKYAKHLLKDTDLSISEIGSQLGYSNLSNFSSAFKKYLGENPVEYRKKCMWKHKTIRDI